MATGTATTIKSQAIDAVERGLRQKMECPVGVKRGGFADMFELKVLVVVGTLLTTTLLSRLDAHAVTGPL